MAGRDEWMKWMNKMNGCMNGWMYECTINFMNGCLHERIGEWT